MNVHLEPTVEVLRIFKAGACPFESPFLASGIVVYSDHGRTAEIRGLHATAALDFVSLRAGLRTLFAGRGVDTVVWESLHDGILKRVKVEI